jgi:hypothetical protein
MFDHNTEVKEKKMGRVFARRLSIYNLHGDY